MKKQIITIILMLSLINLVSAVSIYSGENYTFSVDTTDNLVWDVVGNLSNMEGFYVFQDKYDTYSNITFSTDINYAPDSFTIILFSNETKEIIKEVPVPGSCPSCGGGGGTRTVYKNNPVYLIDEKYILKEVPVINETIDTITEDKIIEIKKPFYKDLWFYLLVIFIIFIIGLYFWENRG